MVEHVPVEFLAVASYGFPFRVEEEVVGDAFVGLGAFQVGRCGDVESLDDFPFAELLAIVGRLVAVKLDEVERIVVGDAFDLFDVFIDEHADTLGVDGHVLGKLADEAFGMGPEDESHPVDTLQGVHLSDVVGVAHAADFHYHGVDEFNGLSGAIGLLGR